MPFSMCNSAKITLLRISLNFCWSPKFIFGPTALFGLSSPMPTEQPVLPPANRTSFLPVVQLCSQHQMHRLSSIRNVDFLQQLLVASYKGMAQGMIMFSVIPLAVLLLLPIIIIIVTKNFLHPPCISSSCIQHIPQEEMVQGTHLLRNLQNSCRTEAFVVIIM